MDVAKVGQGCLYFANGAEHETKSAMQTEVQVDKQEQAESELISKAKTCVTRSGWELGGFASKWCVQYANGRTDSDFAELVGVSQQQVNYARRIYDRFYNHGCKLPFSWATWRRFLPLKDIELSLDAVIVDSDGPQTVESVMTHYRFTTGQSGLDLQPIDPKPEAPVAAPKKQESQPATPTVREESQCIRVPASENRNTPEVQTDSHKSPRADATTICTDPPTEADQWLMFESNLARIERIVADPKKVAAIFRQRADKLDPPE